MAATDEPLAKAVGYLCMWVAAVVFFVVVLVTDYEFDFGGSRQLSERASDYLAAAGAVFSAWAVLAWARRLRRGGRA